MAKKQAPSSAQIEPEPRLIARFVGEQFGTLLVVGIVMTAVGLWEIWNKVPPISLALYAWTGVGAAICAATWGLRYLLAEEVDTAQQRVRSLKEAKLLLKETRRGLRREKRRLKPVQVEDLQAAAAALTAARDERNWSALRDALTALDRKLDDYLSFARKSTAREYTESIAVAVAIALLLRAFVVEAFKIPSGSMIPTLQVGDHIFVNKFIYGIRLPWPLDETEFGKKHQKFFMDIRKPKRGEVIVFKYPVEPDKDFIKRIVAVEGDTVELRDDVLYINGKATAHQKIDSTPCEYEDYEELSGAWHHRRCDAYRDVIDGHAFTTISDPGATTDSWPQMRKHPYPAWLPPGLTKFTVPRDNVFVMGDNRDNSHDSRFWGTVPLELIKGKAMIIWWSAGEPEGIRIKRMGQLIE